MSKPTNFTICCADKGIDAINNKFLVRIDSNLNKKIWMGVCLLDIVRRYNFVNCFGLGKGTYGISQSNGSFYGGNAAISHHENNQYNSIFNASVNAVIN